MILSYWKPLWSWHPGYDLLLVSCLTGGSKSQSLVPPLSPDLLMLESTQAQFLELFSLPLNPLFIPSNLTVFNNDISICCWLPNSYVYTRPVSWPLDSYSTAWSTFLFWLGSSNLTHPKMTSWFSLKKLQYPQSFLTRMTKIPSFHLPRIIFDLLLLFSLIPNL